MSVSSISRSGNVLSGATISDITQQIDLINSYINANNTSAALQKIQFFYTDLQQNASLDLANLDNTGDAAVAAAIQAMAPIAKASFIGTDSSGLTAINSLNANRGSVQSALAALRAVMTASSTQQRVNTSDMVFYQYSRAGESGLNVQLGQLGDAINSLNQAVTQLNRIENILSVNPGTNFVDDRGELKSFYDSSQPNATANNAPTGTTSDSRQFFNAVPTFKQAEVIPGSTSYNTAIDVLKSVQSQLGAVAAQFTQGSDQYQAIQKVITYLNNYNVSSWSATNQSDWYDTDTPDTSSGDEYYKESYPSGTSAPTNFARLFNDDAFRKSISDALSTAQSQNDVQQQNLRKAEFLYEEFVKSAGDIMDRIYQSIQNVVQKISQ